MTIAVIGLGGAGGNIANEAAKRGLTTGAINFSQKDLDSLEDVKNKLKMMGSEGVGHDRDLAINLVQDHYEMIVDYLRENFSNPSIHVLAFAFATGGGSGSGIAPLLIHIVKNIFEDKVAIAIPIIPDESESTISQLNCASTMQELSRLEIAIFPIDNQQVRNEIPILGKGKLYQTTNSYVVYMLHKVSSYTDKHSKNGNFDKKDFITLLRQRGMAMITEVDLVELPKTHELSQESIASTIQDSWSNSVFTPIEFEYVMKAGIIFDGQEELMPYIDHRMIFDCFRNKLPIDTFEGNYHEQNGQIITILTGLPWIKRRMDIVDRLIEEGSQKFDLVLKVEENHEYKPKNLDFSAKLRQKTQENNKQSLGDLVKGWRK